jgi:hypothetical protein
MDKNLMVKKSLKGFVQILLLSLSTLFLRLCYFSYPFALLLVTLFFVLIISIFWWILPWRFFPYDFVFLFPSFLTCSLWFFFHFLLFVCFTVHHGNWRSAHLLKVINLEDNEITKDEMMCFLKDNQDFERKFPTINVYTASLKTWT